MKKLRPYKHEMLRLADRGKCGRRKKRILIQHGEGFLGLLLCVVSKFRLIVFEHARVTSLHIIMTYANE